MNRDLTNKDFKLTVGNVTYRLRGMSTLVDNAATAVENGETIDVSVPVSLTQDRELTASEQRVFVAAVTDNLTAEGKVAA